jgi:hypothetical protein
VFLGNLILHPERVRKTKSQPAGVFGAEGLRVMTLVAPSPANLFAWSLMNSRLMNVYPTSEGLVDSDLSAEFLAFPIRDATVRKSGLTEPPPLFYFAELGRQTFELPG